MEQREKYLQDEGADDLFQKYIDMKVSTPDQTKYLNPRECFIVFFVFFFHIQNEHEMLLRNIDEKDELVLKAQKVTAFLREEKEKLNYKFAEREKFYKETIQQLKKV